MFIVISIHALRVEGDAYPGTKCVNKLYFYPRPPGGGRLLGATTQNTFKFISIHALRVEGDHEHFFNRFAKVKISIHALRVEGDSKNGQNFRLFLRKREKNLPL